MSTKLDELLAEAQRLAALTRAQVRLVCAEAERTRHGEVIPFPARAVRPTMRLPPVPATILPFVRNVQGVTSIEYSLLAAGIALSIIAIVASLGGTLSGMFGNIAASLAGG